MRGMELAQARHKQIQFRKPGITTSDLALEQHP